MPDFSLVHLSDASLLEGLASLVARERAVTARLLAHLAEVDSRRLYLPAGCPSMFAYCVRVLGFSEDAAARRIRAARVARCHPEMFPLVAEGRLHLTAIGLLAPHLSPENSGELIRLALGKGRDEVELLLAARFPGTEPIAMVWGVGAPADRLAPARVDPQVGGSGADADSHAPARVDLQVGGSGADADSHAPARVDLQDGAPGADRSLGVQPGPELGLVRSTGISLRPIAEGRYVLQVALGHETLLKLERARALLRHAEPSGDLALVLDRALDALLRHLEGRRLGAGPKRNHPDRGNHLTQRDPNGVELRSRKVVPEGVRSPLPRSNPRRIPAAIRRAVWERDDGRCSFESGSGRRCDATRGLEFDHVLPVARGGESTPGNLRLRCRGHNQFEAERAFGTEFMAARRGPRTVRAASGPPGMASTERRGPDGGRPTFRTPAAPRMRAELMAPATLDAERARAAEEVVPWLRALGFDDRDARSAAWNRGSEPGAPIEARVRAALSSLSPGRRIAPLARPPVG